MNSIATAHWDFFWIMIAMAILTVVFSRRYLSPGQYFCRTVLDCQDEGRLETVVVQRAELEGKYVRWQAGIPISAFTVLCAICALLTPVTPSLWYGVSLVFASAISAISYLQVRNRSEHRAAVLQPRRLSNVFPIWLFALCFVDALTPLTFIGEAANRLPAFLLLAAALSCAYFAVRIAQMPALLAGKDIQIERFVDLRLRKARALNLMFFTACISFVFASFASAGSKLAFENWVWDLTAVLALSAMCWLLAFSFTPIRNRDIARFASNAN